RFNGSIVSTLSHCTVRIFCTSDKLKTLLIAERAGSNSVVSQLANLAVLLIALVVQIRRWQIVIILNCLNHPPCKISRGCESKRPSLKLSTYGFLARDN